MNIQTLWDLLPRRTGRIVEISPRIDELYRNRLNDLGFMVGEAVACVRQTPFKGPRLFKIGDSVFSLDRDLAQSVMVTVVGE